MKDYGPQAVAEGKALHPGDVDRQDYSYQRPIREATVKVVAIVYADQTCEWTDAAALGRIEDHRKSLLLMDGISVKAMKDALADSANDSPGSKAGSILRQHIPADPASIDAGVSPNYLEYYARELEHAPQEASRAGISERQYVSDRLAALEKRVEQERGYAQIRRQP